MDSVLYHKAQRIINDDFEKFGNKTEETSIPSYEIDYIQLEDEVKKLIRFTREGQFVGDMFHSLFIFGMTGVGKTEIISQIAKEENCVYHKLELQKVPVEILQGFPYLKNVASENGEKTVAKLAPSTILPPPDDDRVWILHFDEFNKADPEKMAAVMNLIITGELGGSADYDEVLKKSVKYKLPRKTVIIGSGNTKEQKNVENLNIVSSMDNATSERWHRTVLLPYNAESWIENYALKPFDFFGHKLSTRIPAIILNFVLNKALDTGKSDAPFIIPVVSGSESGLEIERTTSPRAWTLVADRMLLDIYDEFMRLDNDSRVKFSKLAEKNKIDDFDLYLNDPNVQIKHFTNQSYEFGIKGNQIVKEVVSNYAYFAENRVLPEDVIFYYKKNRPKIKELSKKKGIILFLLLGIGHYLNTIEKVDDVEKVAVNISTFISDTNISAEDVVAFIQTLEKSSKEHVQEFKDVMYDISDIYKNAYSGYSYTSEREIK